jgi:Peptidase propeptide and YPEB domain
MALLPMAILGPFGRTPISGDNHLREANVQRCVRLSVPGLALAVALVASGCSGSEDSDLSPAAGSPAGGSSVGPIAPIGSPGTSSTARTGEPEVTAQEAQDIALETVGGGWILKTEAEDQDDVLVAWEVTVVAPTGEHREVTVDITNGNVLGHDVDD